MRLIGPEVARTGAERREKHWLAAGARSRQQDKELPGLFLVAARS